MLHWVGKDAGMSTLSHQQAWCKWVDPFISKFGSFYPKQMVHSLTLGFHCLYQEQISRNIGTQRSLLMAFVIAGFTMRENWKQSHSPLRMKWWNEVVSHTLNPSTQEQRQADLRVRGQPCPGQPGLHREILSWKREKEREREEMGGRRDGSVVKSTGCSSQGPKFNFQHPHGSSQLSPTPVPGNPTPLHRHRCRQTPIQIHKSLKRKKEWNGGAWRDGSVVTWLSKGPEFGSQLP